ncbi:toll/interleukin-1 receptor domain-containing protein [Hoeflea sp.]|uniref:toll/interleukin-1 receptor domain-containing protein n=1 Tax=Hoeflea sp. TaxID=1940281 RepID=UPI003B01B791
MGQKIFINYRREDDPGTAGRLHDRLVGAFGDDNVFMDVEGQIRAGDDYVEVLKEKARGCGVMLAIIGPRWMAAADHHGNSRIENPNDWVRVELETALSEARRVVPVLVGDATMPLESELPKSLASLARRHAVRITQERFRVDSDGLVDQLRTLISEMEAAEAAMPEEQVVGDDAVNDGDADAVPDASQEEVDPRSTEPLAAQVAGIAQDAQNANSEMLSSTGTASGRSDWAKELAAPLANASIAGIIDDLRLGQQAATVDEEEIREIPKVPAKREPSRVAKPETQSDWQKAQAKEPGAGFQPPVWTGLLALPFAFAVFLVVIFVFELLSPN